MAELTQAITAEGLQIDIPPAMLEELGWEQGQQVEIRPGRDRLTIRPCEPLEARIHSTALGYLSRFVGDATAAGEIEWRGGRAVVPVSLSYVDRRLGELVFSDRGELLVDESTPPHEMIAAADAP